MPNKHKILVVEDDQLMQKALAFSLEKEGFDVTRISSVKETADALESLSYSAVITDICLPDGDGLNVHSLVNDKLPDTPVLAITGYPNTELGRRARALFGEYLLEKPFKKKVLIMKVQELIDKASLRE